METGHLRSRCLKRRSAVFLKLTFPSFSPCCPLCCCQQSLNQNYGKQKMLLDNELTWRRVVRLNVNCWAPTKRPDGKSIRDSSANVHRRSHPALCVPGVVVTTNEASRFLAHTQKVNAEVKKFTFEKKKKELVMNLDWIPLSHIVKRADGKKKKHTKTHICAYMYKVY